MQMDMPQATFALTLIVVGLQAYNLYITAGIKVWVMERFVSKDDLPLLMGKNQ